MRSRAREWRRCFRFPSLIGSIEINGRKPVWRSGRHVSIPYRKYRNSHCGATVLQGRSFPSLIGSIEITTLTAYRIIGDQFPSLIGSIEIAYAGSGDLRLLLVSIPYRKYRNNGRKPVWRSGRHVSIPYRKYRNILCAWNIRKIRYGFHPL